MATGNKLKCSIRIEGRRYYNADSDFGIIVATPLKVSDGTPVVDDNGYIIAKGKMPEPRIGGQYLLTATEVDDPKWGRQYQILNMCTSIALDMDDTEGQRIYLETIFTPNQVFEMYQALENPYRVFAEEDLQSLLTVKGCGFKTASKWMAKFKRHIEYSRIYVELEEYELTSSIIKKLIEHYGSADLVIQTVKKNPYCLIDIQGIGWKTCDELALKGGMGIYCAERVEAFIKHYLKQKAEEGFTYVYSNSQLMDAIINALGENIPDEPITMSIKHLGDKLWWSEDREKVGLAYYINLERKIAEKLCILRNAENKFKYANWKSIVKEQEAEQGWEFTEQQIEGLQAVLENNVVIITGYAGTGKSSIVSGMLSILREYSFAQCALAGRAAARLAEVTKQEGFTIHRLLGFPMGDEKNGGFAFHEENHLDYDIIIVDEISMVDGVLFYRLISALRPGTKLVLLGDIGQLESIGCSNIAHDLIESPDIKSVQLTKIHRQAASSAIITDSLAVRMNQQVIEKDFTGCITKGELQDLTYECYSDVGNTFYKVLQHFQKYMALTDNILDVQVIVPRKDQDAGTWNINSSIQELYNPISENKPELLVHYDASHAGFLRIGDKVMNVSNNYKTVTYEGQWEVDKEEAENIGHTTPIYNGNIGIVTKINNTRYEIVVDFIDIGEILITKENLHSITLGYACTVHKCQGSQFPYVVLGIDFSSYSLLTKELVYTAITRASKQCTAVVQTSALRYAVMQNGVYVKQTLLQELLAESAKPKLLI